VIISGGGPVGLCLALLLAEQEIPVTVIEAEAEIVRDLRASTFHPPTLDMLEPLGITPTLVERGLPCPTWQIRLHPSGDRAVFDLSVLEGDTRHPYRLQCEQWKLSEALLEKLRRSLFAEVRFATQVEAATDNGDHVSVEIESGGRRETLRARYAIGCDGARSVVRKSMGLPFEGLTYPETTLLVTTLFRLALNVSSTRLILLQADAGRIRGQENHDGIARRHQCDWTVKEFSTAEGFSVEITCFLELQCGFGRNGKCRAAPEGHQAEDAGQRRQSGAPIELGRAAQPVRKVLDRGGKRAIMGPGGDETQQGGKRGHKSLGRRNAGFIPGRHR